MNIDEQQSLLKRELKANGASLVGFGDISLLHIDLISKLPVAISIGIKYDARIVKNLHTDEETFEEHLTSLNTPMRNLISITEDLLNEWGYDFESVPISIPIKDNRQLLELETFPHKTAATSAGLGWIGKCSLLVTPKYGPRIKLATILTNAPFKVSEPQTTSRCGSCTLCVKACPYGAVKGADWEAGIERERLVDAYLCNEMRLGFIEKIGRKHSCSLCLQACRIGEKEGVENGY